MELFFRFNVATRAWAKLDRVFMPMFVVFVLSVARPPVLAPSLSPGDLLRCNAAAFVDNRNSYR